MKKNQTKNISVSLFFLLFFFAYCNYVLFNNKLVDKSIVSKYTDGRKNSNFLKEHHGKLFELYRKRKLNFAEIVDQVYILENGRNSLKSYEIYSLILKDFHLFDNTFFLRFILHYVLCSLFLIIGILIAVAFFTLLERKVMAAMQRRKGPNVVGFWGLLQPLADGLKLLAKEIVVPKRSSVRFFLGSPLYTFFMSLLGWCAIPWSEEVVYADPRLSALYVFAVSSLGVYGVLLAGWSSNSKYAFLGGLRSAAQMISYEVSLGFILVIVGLFAGTYNLREIIYKQEDVWYCFPMFPLVLIFFVSMLAETNRAPFDLPEAEAELVSGYNTEYSSIVFAMFFLGEYSSMLLMAAIMTIFFFGGWYPPMFVNFEVFDGFWFFFKVTCIAFFYVWVRATLPRYRYNQLMSIGWKIFLPITFGLLILYSGLLLYFDGLPVNSDYNTFVVESILNLREKKGVFFELREYYIKFRKKNP